MCFEMFDFSQNVFTELNATRIGTSVNTQTPFVLVGNNSCREVVANLPSCLATSRDNVVGNNNHLAHRRLSLPVSFDLRFVFLGRRSERSEI